MTTRPLGGSGEDLRSRAIRAAKEGDNEQARDLLHQGLQANPIDSTALLWLAHVSPYRSEQLDSLSRVLAIDPGHTRAREHQAVILAQEGPYVPGRADRDSRRRGRRPPGVALLGALLLVLGLFIGSALLVTLLEGEGPGSERLSASILGRGRLFDYYVVVLIGVVSLLSLLGGLGLLFRRSWGWLTTVLLVSWVCMTCAAVLLVLLSRLGLNISVSELGRRAPPYLGGFVLSGLLLALIAREPVIAYANVTPAFKGWALLLSLMLGLLLALFPLLLAMLA